MCLFTRFLSSFLQNRVVLRIVSVFCFIDYVGFTKKSEEVRIVIFFEISNPTPIGNVKDL